MLLVRRIAFCLALLGLASCSGGGGGGSPPPPVGGGAVTQGINQAFDPPTWTGPHAVGTAVFYWEDLLREETITASAGDNRELMVQVFYPTDSALADYQMPVVRDRHWNTLAGQQAVASRVLRRSNYDGVSWRIEDEPALSAAEADYPVVIWSHGGGGAIAKNVFIAAELASRGYIVASVNHTYFSDFVEFPDGRVIFSRGFGINNDSVITAAEEALLATAQDLWSDDQLFVLEQLITLDQDPASDFFGRMDLNRLAAGGFSFGGASAYEAASKDPRIRAVVEGDGTIWEPAGLNIAVPMLFILSGSGSQFSIFNQVAADGYAVTFDGNITHLAFEDIALYWAWDFPAQRPFGPMDSQQALLTIVEVSDQFLIKYLDGGLAPALDDPLQTPNGVQVRIFP
jgi:dienelactone hydrolase